MYFGDHIDFGENKRMNPAWLPHGLGEIRMDRVTIDDDGDREVIRGEVKMKGLFEKGIIHGTSHIKFKENNEYIGDVRKGILHGTGVLTEGASIKYIEPPDGKRAYVERIAGISRPAILRKNLVICYQDELMVGKQIEIDDPVYRASYSLDKPRAVLVEHKKDWKYRVRFHDEFRPVERVIDLQGLKSFKVLHHLPLIHPLTEYNLDVDTKKFYKYDEDVFKGNVKYDIEGDRRMLDMSYNKVSVNLITYARTTNRKENFFEPLAIGVGTAMEEEEKARIAAAKKKQFDDMIAQKRKDEEDDKQKLIQEEQEKMLHAAKEIKKKMEEELKTTENSGMSDEAVLAKMVEEEDSKVKSKIGVNKGNGGFGGVGGGVVKNTPKRVRRFAAADADNKADIADLLVQLDNAYLSSSGTVQFSKGVLRMHAHYNHNHGTIDSGDEEIV